MNDPLIDKAKEKAKSAMPPFHDVLDAFIKTKPNVAEGFLVFAALELWMSRAKLKIWTELMKTFPGTDLQKAGLLDKLDEISKMIADCKPEKPKTNLWVPKKPDIAEGSSLAGQGN